MSNFCQYHELCDAHISYLFKFFFFTTATSYDLYFCDSHDKHSFLNFQCLTSGKPIKTEKNHAVFSIFLVHLKYAYVLYSNFLLSLINRLCIFLQMTSIFIFKRWTEEILTNYGAVIYLKL